MILSCSGCVGRKLSTRHPSSPGVSCSPLWNVRRRRNSSICKVEMFAIGCRTWTFVEEGKERLKPRSLHCNTKDCFNWDAIAFFPHFLRVNLSKEVLRTIAPHRQKGSWKIIFCVVLHGSREKAEGQDKCLSKTNLSASWVSQTFSLGVCGSWKSSCGSVQWWNDSIWNCNL